MSVIVGDPEAMALLMQITTVLQEGCGWTWVEWNHPSGPFMNVYAFPETPNVGQGGASIGVRVEVSPTQADFGPAASALIEALKMAGLEVSALGVEAPDVPNHDTIHIRIGKKPTI